MPDDVRRALLDIVRLTLGYIRAKAKDPRVSFVLSDHAHNIPGIIEHRSIGAFRYYWEVERPIFLREMKVLNESVGDFEGDWQTLDRFYKSLPQT